jgi:uncharacterized protein (DUF1800 family)
VPLSSALNAKRRAACNVRRYERVAPNIVNVRLDTSTDPQVGFRPRGTLDVATALAPYRGHFGPRQAAHLLRRAGFGGSAADVAALASRDDPQRAVDALLHPADPELEFAAYPPELGTLTSNQYGQRKTAVQLWWLDRMLRTHRPLAEKMTLFWHNHFATAVSKVPPEMMARQIDLFRLQGLGNFRTLLASVTRDPAMLVWLDNRSNSKQHPNENYAREVMELFVLGLGNYTEDDVREGARAFTGWTLVKGEPAFNPKLHDDGAKTFLGRTGTFDADDVIAIMVEQPIHQRFMARALLEAFVYSDPEPELIEALAQVYALSGLDLAQTVGTMLRSNVFFSPRAYRAIPKSPIEFTIGALRYVGATQIPPNLPGVLARLGQEPINPPSVKGWDGGPAWINTSTLLARFNFINTLVASPGVQPDAIVRAAGGFDAARVVEVLVSTAVQDDVPSNVRSTLVGYLDSTAAPGMASSANPLPFGPENYQEKVRGLLALTLNLPINQLD